MAMLIITSYRAQRLAKLQMNFVTTISHELRTPLTVISSAADNIAHGVVEGKQQLTQYGSVIGNQARQLSGLVEQILLFAATREGQQRYSSRLLKVSEIIDAALANTAGLIRTARFHGGTENRLRAAPVMGDLSALSQCLQNLITNALKYGSRTALDRNARPRSSETRAAGKRDSDQRLGSRHGHRSADMPHIFEPFYRSSSVAAAQIHGTGPGLASGEKHRGSDERRVDSPKRSRTRQYLHAAFAGCRASRQMQAKCKQRQQLCNIKILADRKLCR